MIRYIPLADISNALNGASIEALISRDEEVWRTTVNELSKEYSEKDILKAIELLKTNGAEVFHGWISQHKPLQEFMQNGVINPLELTATVNNHQLFPEFQRFVSVYLQEQLLAVKATSDEELSDLFTYVILLDKGVRDVVESQLFKPVHQRVQSLLEIAPTLRDRELQNTVSGLLSMDILNCVNSLSKAMYREKVFYVESFLDLIRSGVCTPRLSNWILKQLDQLKLNKEHNDKLLDIRNDLKSGRIKGLKTVTKKRSVFRPFRVIGSLLTIGALTVLIFYFFKNYDRDIDEVNSNSAFKTFTQQERAQLDSIIQILQAKHNNSRLDIDTTSSGQLIFPSYLAMRRSFDNPLLEQIYEDWNKDGILQDLYASGTTKEVEAISRRSNEKPLNTKPGTISVSLVNESSYDLIFYTGKNDPGAPVYSSIIPQDTTVELLLNEGDVFFCVAGRSLQKFDVPQNVSPDLLPGFNFKEHFGSTDDNYLESMNSPYFVKRSPDQLRILIRGNKRDYFSVTELEGALEAY